MDHTFKDGDDTGKLTVSVRYDLRAGEDPDNLSVWYMSNGKLSEQRECRYYEDHGVGYVEFVTEHLSNYAVMYTEPSSGSDGGSSSEEQKGETVSNGTSQGTDLITIASMTVAVVAMIAALGAIFLARRH